MRTHTRHVLQAKRHETGNITRYQTLLTAYRLFNSLAPKRVVADFPIKVNTNNTRAHYMFDDYLTRLDCIRKLPTMYDIKKCWNSLNQNLKRDNKYAGFKTKVHIELIKGQHLNRDN